MRRLAGCLTVFLCLIATPQARADGEVCRHYADATRDTTLSILHSDKKFMEKHEALVVLFEKTLDMGWVEQYAAGNYLAKASEADRKAFDAVYRAYLTDYYIGGFDEGDLNDIIDVNVTKFRHVEANVYYARVKITQHDDDPIDVEMHLMENPEGVCHVRDFTVEGVSLLDSQHEEIQSLGNIGGLKFITKKLSSRPQTR